MPRASDAGGSNGLGMIAEEVPSSVGTNSSTSESRPDTSGDSAPETGSSLQSPAQETGSPSEAGQQVNPLPSSTADSADGNTQETGPSQPSQPGSSEASTGASEATPGQTDEGQAVLDKAEAQVDKTVAAREMIGLAHQAYDRGDLQEALDMLDEAAKLDPSVAPEADAARKVVAKAATKKK